MVKRDWCTKIKFLLSSQWSKLSLLLIHFRKGPNICLHCSKTWHRTYPICHAPLSKSARYSFVSRRNHRSLACEQKPFAVWSSCWSKGYSVNKSAMGRFLVTFAQKTVDKWPQNSRRFGATTEAFAATCSLTHVSPLAVVLCKI